MEFYNGSQNYLCNEDPSTLMNFSQLYKNRKRVRCYSSDGNLFISKRLKESCEEAQRPEKCYAAVEEYHIKGDSSSKWGFTDLPQELILKIFSFLFYDDLVTASFVCPLWREVVYDRSLWRGMKTLRIQGRRLDTIFVKRMIELSQELEELSIWCRNDIEELLQFEPEEKPNLTLLELKHCSCLSHCQIGIQRALTSIISNSPKLKILRIEYMPLRSKLFYKVLALNFYKLETVIITNTAMAEMVYFVEALRRFVPGLQFRDVAMMGRADGRRIYWGPVLGLSIRPLTYVPQYVIPHVTYNYVNYG